MRVPKHLAIFGKNYTLKIIEDPRLDDGSPVKGYYDSDNEEIVVCSKLKGDKLKHTILHEMAHALHHRLHADSDVDDAYIHIIIDTMMTMVIESFKLQFR